jgi:hypothetical protein
MLQGPLNPEPLVDPVVISLAALIVAIVSAVFTGGNLLRQFLQDRKDKGKLSASVVLRLQWQDEYGGSPEARDEQVLTAKFPTGTLPTFLIHAVNIGHRPVFIRGVYARFGLPFFHRTDLGGYPTNQKVDEAGQAWIYTKTPPDLQRITTLVVCSANGKWTVDRRSLKKALTLAASLEPTIAQQDPELVN